MTEFTVVFNANITDAVLLEKIVAQATEIDFDSWKTENDQTMATSKMVQMTTRTRTNSESARFQWRGKTEIV